MDYNIYQGKRTAETGCVPVCRGWSTGTDEADQEGQEMKEKITELLQDLAAGASIFIFLFFLYILMAVVG